MVDIEDTEDGVSTDVESYLLQRLGWIADVDTVSSKMLSLTSLSDAKTPVGVSETITDWDKAGIVEASSLCCYCQRADKKICLLLIKRCTASVFVQLLSRRIRLPGCLSINSYAGCKRCIGNRSPHVLKSHESCTKNAGLLGA